MNKTEVYNVIKDDWENDNFEAALEKLDKLLIDNPNDENILIRKALVLRNLDRDEEATQIYKNVENINPKNEDVLINKAHDLEDLDKQEEALKIYDEILKINPQNIEALVNKGFYYSNLIQDAEDATDDENEQQQNTDKAVLKNYKEIIDKICNQLLNISTDNMEDNDYIIFFLSTQAERYEEANTFCDKVLNIYPDNIDVLDDKANCLYHLDKYEECIAICDRILSLDGNNIEAYENKYNCLKELQREEEGLICINKALDICERALIKNSEDLDILRKKAVILNKIKKFDESIKTYEQIIEICNKKLIDKPDDKLALQNKEDAEFWLKLVNTDKEFYNRFDKQSNEKFNFIPVILIIIAFVIYYFLNS